jgi:hypothetical protein
MVKILTLPWIVITAQFVPPCRDSKTMTCFAALFVQDDGEERVSVAAECRGKGYFGRKSRCWRM